MDRLLKRLAFLVEITRRMKASDRSRTRFGKTAMQKLLYLLQQRFGVSVGYRFELYTYGPYSSEVMQDLDYVSDLGILKLTYDQDEGFDISCGPNAGQMDRECAKIRAEVDPRLQRLLEEFGDLSARDLELRATITWVRKEDPRLDRDGVIQRVERLKPKYDKTDILSAYNQLESPRDHKFPLGRISGEPLSQTIIRERR